ncbi:MAG: HAMP domain-containing protein [Calditrichia bacterium]
MNLKFKNMGLRGKITAIILAGTLLFTGLVLFATYEYVSNILTASLIDQGNIIAENISENAAEKIISQDTVSLTALSEKYKFFDNVEYVLIADEQGRIIADTYNGNVPQSLKNDYVYRQSTDNAGNKVTLLETEGNNSAYFDLLVPVEEGLLGFVRVGLKKSYVDDRLRSTILFLGVVFVVGIFLAVVLAIFIITWQVSRPIDTLTQAAYKISMGDLEQPVQVRVKNEIGTLAEAIERMRESLKTSLERLRRK